MMQVNDLGPPSDKENKFYISKRFRVLRSVPQRRNIYGKQSSRLQNSKGLNGWAPKQIAQQKWMIISTHILYSDWNDLN